MRLNCPYCDDSEQHHDRGPASNRYWGKLSLEFDRLAEIIATFVSHPTPRSH